MNVLIQSLLLLSVSSSIAVAQLPNQPDAPMKADRHDAAALAINPAVLQSVLNIDGVDVKAQVNYDLNAAHAMFLYLPEVGTVVVSASPIAGATRFDNGFHGKALTFSVNEHRVRLSGTGPLLGRGTHAAYVRVDTDTAARSFGKEILLGFGRSTAAPYAWGMAESKSTMTAAKIDMPQTFSRTDASTAATVRRVSLSGAMATQQPTGAPTDADPTAE